MSVAASCQAHAAGRLLAVVIAYNFMRALNGMRPRLGQARVLVGNQGEGLMGTSERGGPIAGPFASWHQALEAFGKNSEPMLKSIGRWNLELMGLSARRARAWMEIPAQLSRCKTPQDLVREQLLFWQHFAVDYAEGTQRLTSALSAVTGSAIAGFQNGKDTLARDYINFPEGNAAAAESSQRERRAA
jgi:hypothetical protein